MVRSSWRSACWPIPLCAGGAWASGWELATDLRQSSAVMRSFLVFKHSRLAVIHNGVDRSGTTVPVCRPDAVLLVLYDIYHRVSGDPKRKRVVFNATPSREAVNLARDPNFHGKEVTHHLTGCPCTCQGQLCTQETPYLLTKNTTIYTVRSSFTFAA